MPSPGNPASLDPGVTLAMGVAFERACSSLGLADTTDSMTQVVAIKIIEVAKTGERDAVRLYDTVMEWSARAA